MKVIGYLSKMRGMPTPLPPWISGAIPHRIRARADPVIPFIHLVLFPYAVRGTLRPISDLQTHIADWQWYDCSAYSQRTWRSTAKTIIQIDSWNEQFNSKK